MHIESWLQLTGKIDISKLYIPGIIVQPASHQPRPHKNYDAIS